MRIFKVIIRDGKQVIKRHEVSENQATLVNSYRGYGRFEQIEDVTKKYINSGCVECLENDLLNARWGEVETSLICKLLEEYICSIESEEN